MTRDLVDIANTEGSLGRQWDAILEYWARLPDEDRQRCVKLSIASELSPAEIAYFNRPLNYGSPS